MDINHLTLEELKIVKDAITQRINELSGETSQQETLEEAIENTLEENYAYKDDGGDRVYFDTQVEKCIIDMTKWQSERMYSEEDLKLWLMYRDIYLYNHYTTYLELGLPLQSVDDFIKESYEHLMNMKKNK